MIKGMNEQEAHKHFSVQCFNGAWVLLDKEDRTADEDGLLRETAHASLYHWLKRDDCEASNVSIGLWQISRVHAVLGEGKLALHYATECVRVSELQKLPPFYRGYGYEAEARAALLTGDGGRAADALRVAQECAQAVENEEKQGLLQADLATLAESIQAPVDGV
jgi:hypothetical protein